MAFSKTHVRHKIHKNSRIVHTDLHSAIVLRLNLLDIYVDYGMTEHTWMYGVAFISKACGATKKYPSLNFTLDLDWNLFFEMSDTKFSYIPDISLCVMWWFIYPSVQCLFTMYWYRGIYISPIGMHKYWQPIHHCTCRKWFVTSFYSLHVLPLKDWIRLCITPRLIINRVSCRIKHDAFIKKSIKFVCMCVCIWSSWLKIWACTNMIDSIVSLWIELT